MAGPAELFPVKILFWAPYINPGGGLKLIGSLVGALARADGVTSIRLVHPGSVDPSPWFPDRSSGRVEFWPLEDPSVYNRIIGRIAGIPFTTRLRREWMRRNRKPADAGEYLQFQFEEASRGCDIAYNPWPHNHHQFGLLPKGSIPWVVTIQDFLALDFPWDPALSVREYSNLQDVVTHAAHVVLSSQASQDALRRHFPEAQCPTSIIHHAVLPISTRVARAPGPADNRYFLAATNIVPHKNLELLLLAWSRWARAAEFPLVVMGHLTDAIRPLHYPALPANSWIRLVTLQALVSRLGNLIPDRVRLLGYVPEAEASRLMSGATALVMPSLGEGGGSYPVEEALHAGVPVLCSDIPVMREHASRRTAPITWFDPDSVDSLVRALDRFVEDEPALRSATVVAADDPRPSWEEIGNAYAAVLRRTLQDSQASPTSPTR